MRICVLQKDMFRNTQKWLLTSRRMRFRKIMSMRTSIFFPNPVHFLVYTPHRSEDSFPLLWVILLWKPIWIDTYMCHMSQRLIMRNQTWLSWRTNVLDMSYDVIFEYLKNLLFTFLVDILSCFLYRYKCWNRLVQS